MGTEALKKAADTGEKSVRAPDPIPSSVDVVVVHGMGKQAAGETLLEWSEAVLSRIDWFAGASPVENLMSPFARRVALWFARLSLRFSRRFEADSETVAEAVAEDVAVARRAPGAAAHDDTQSVPSLVHFDSVVLTSSDQDRVNANVEFLDLEGRLHHASVRFTEARWSESFVPLSRAQIFGWGFGFVWRAARKIGLAATSLLWFSSSGYFGFGLLYSLPTIGATWVLIAVGGALIALFLVVAGPLLLLPFAKLVVQPIVDVLIDFIGDAPVFTNRPVRAAAMREVVENALTAARTRAGADGQVLVIAHSEGAAITAELLFSAGRLTKKNRVDTFVTVGAAVTLLGRPGWLERRLTPTQLATGGNVVKFNLVRSWAALPDELRPRWINFWALWDVVPAGPISTGRMARRARWKAVYAPGDGIQSTETLGPEEHGVHNTASSVGDHQSYASNIVQVVDPIARIILGTEPDATDVELDSRLAERNRAHVRGVKALGFNRLVILALAGFALLTPVVAERFSASPWTASLPDLLAQAFDLDVSKGLWALVFSLQWLPLAFAVVAAAALLTVLNAAVWVQYEQRLVDTRLGRSLAVRWKLMNLLWRVALIGFSAYLVLWFVAPGWPLWLSILAATIAALALSVLPLLGRMPRPIAENHGT